MSKLTLELPESFQRRAAMLTALEGMSFEHFVALAGILWACAQVAVWQFAVARLRQEGNRRPVPPAEAELAKRQAASVRLLEKGWG